MSLKPLLLSFSAITAAREDDGACEHCGKYKVPVDSGRCEVASTVVNWLEGRKACAVYRGTGGGVIVHSTRYAVRSVNCSVAVSSITSANTDGCWGLVVAPGAASCPKAVDLCVSGCTGSIIATGAMDSGTSQTATSSDTDDPTSDGAVSTGVAACSTEVYKRDFY